jgi:hypothetical protein
VVCPSGKEVLFRAVYTVQSVYDFNQGRRGVGYLEVRSI